MIQKPNTSLFSKQTNHAFTLVEIIFVLVILGVVGAGLTSLIIDSSRSMAWSINKSMITNDFRQFTGKISQDALNASHAYLYPDFNSITRNNRRETRLSGDCLVLVSTEPFRTSINAPRSYQRIVIYYRDASDTPTRPVFRIERFFDPRTIDPRSIPTTIQIEDLLAAERNRFGQPETVIEQSRGLSGNQLFYRATDEAFLINGEIIHGNDSQRVTNTYNLTISTRG
jgi:prepilin-type N-terminal cleavage/methylation domain-containing protein